MQQSNDCEKEPLALRLPSTDESHSAELDNAQDDELQIGGSSVHEDVIPLGLQLYLRGAAAEFVLLDDQKRSLMYAKRQMRTINRQIDNLNSEIRGFENRVSYLEHSMPRDFFSLGMRRTRSHSTNGVELQGEIQKLSEAQRALKQLQEQQSEVDSQIRQFNHLTDRINMLLDRTFNQTNQQFPELYALSIHQEETKQKLTEASDNMRDVTNVLDAISEISSLMSSLTANELNDYFTEKSLKTTDVRISSIKQKVAEMIPKLPKFIILPESVVCYCTKSPISTTLVRIEDLVSLNSLIDFNNLKRETTIIRNELCAKAKQEKRQVSHCKTKQRFIEKTLRIEQTTILQRVALRIDRERASRQEALDPTEPPLVDLPPPYSPPTYEESSSQSTTSLHWDSSSIGETPVSTRSVTSTSSPVVTPNRFSPRVMSVSQIIRRRFSFKNRSFTASPTNSE